jgi:hypothetical protein
MSFEFEPSGGSMLIKQGYNQVAYITDDVVYRCTNSGQTFGGQQVGYIDGTIVYADGNGGKYGGQQAGYVDNGRNFENGNGGPYGGQDIGSAAPTHPMMNLACYLLLT